MPAASNTGWPTANPDSDDGGSFTGAAVELILGKLDQMAAESRQAHPRIPWQACHPIWLTGQVPLSAGAGTLNQGNLYGPEGGYWWDLRTISVWGFTAGTVIVYLNAVGGEELGSTTGPGQFNWSAQELLGPQDNIITQASGVTGSVNVIIRAIEVKTEWLPEYLM